jgi:hypothetical protein
MTGRTYTPRQMPRRFLEGAPVIVCQGVIDIIEVKPAAPLDFDVILRESAAGEVTGLDFDRYGARGCHFFLKPHDARAFRERNRRKRVAWRDLPEPTRLAIVSYLEWTP